MVKTTLRARLLFFHAGFTPTNTEIETAFLIAHNVGFRSTRNTKGLQTIEQADAVAGEVPEAYRKLPVVTSRAEFEAVLVGSKPIETVPVPLAPEAPANASEPPEPAKPTEPATQPVTTPPATAPSWNPN